MRILKGNGLRMGLKYVVLVLISLFFVGQAQASVNVTFIDPTPSNNSVNTTGSVFVNTSISSSVNSSSFIDFDNSLVGWWRFNNESGETSSSFVDWSSYKNNATCVSCPINVSGSLGNSLNFTYGNFLTVPNSDSLQIDTSNITISARIKISNNSDDYFSILGKGTSTGFTNLFAIRGIDGYMIWYIPGIKNWAIGAFSELKSGAWQHVVVTYNGTNMVLYINGTQRAITSATGTFLYDSNSLRIGKSTASTYPFNGSMDDLMIFNRALDSVEIGALYNSSQNALYKNITNQLDGNHSVQAYFQNATGYVDSTEIRNIKVDTISDCSNADYWNWVVLNDTMCNDAVSTFRNGITVKNGTLTLNNVTYSLRGNSTVNPGGNITINESDIKFRSVYEQKTRLTIYGSLSKIINSSISTRYLNDSPVLSVGKDTSLRSHIRVYGNNFLIDGSNISYMDGADYTSGGSRGAVHLWKVSNFTIKNSIFVNDNEAINAMRSNNGLIENNIFHDNTYWMPIYLWGNDSVTKNITVNNNTIYNEDRAIQFTSTENVTFSNNIVYNMTKNWDGYNLAILLNRNNNNTIIKNNNFSDFGSGGIIALDSDNVSITDNYFDAMDINTKFSNTPVMDYNELVTAIGFVESYKGWDSTGSEAFTDNRTNNFAALSSSDVNISGNSFGSNVQVLLQTQGTQNVVHDITGYWKTSYYFPEMFDRIDIYASNNYSEMSSVTTLRTKTGLSSRSISNILQTVFVSPTYRVFFNYVLKKNNFTIYPQNWIRYSNGTVEYMSVPDFYYYDGGRVFGLNKQHTVFSNGTTYIQLLNDTLEPNGYHTLNLTLQLSSGSVDVNVTAWNTTGDYRKVFNLSASASVTAGDFAPNTNTWIYKNGVKWTIFKSNSTGYISFSDTITSTTQYSTTSTTVQDAYTTSTCQSTLNWGVVGSALVVILVVIVAGALAIGFLTGVKFDPVPIEQFVFALIGVVVVGSIGVAIISPIITLVGCP